MKGSAPKADRSETVPGFESQHLRYARVKAIGRPGSLKKNCLPVRLRLRVLWPDIRPANGMWRNRQTHQTQTLAGYPGCGFNVSAPLRSPLDKRPPDA